MFLPVEIPARDGTAVAAHSSEKSCMRVTGRPSTAVVASSITNHTSLPSNVQFLTVAAGADSRSYAALQPVTSVLVSEGDAANDDHGTATIVQYVEAGGDSGIYATANGQLAYPVLDGVYSSNSGTFYATSGGGSNTPTVAFASLPGQNLTTAVVGNTTYLMSHLDRGLDQTNSPLPLASTSNGSTQPVTSAAISVLSPSRTSPQTESNVVSASSSSGSNSGPGSDNDGSQLLPPNRVSPVTVQWLFENYETAEGVSLPRSTLYRHYIRHCAEQGLDPVNPASFGKLIRSVFIGLRTRRLGTRGNSKYHYYGIRVKLSSPLRELPINEEDEGDENDCVSPSGAESKTDQRHLVIIHDGVSASAASNGRKIAQAGQHNVEDGQGDPNVHMASAVAQHVSHGFLGEPTTPFPRFPQIDFASIELLEGVTLEDVEVFRALYEENCEGVMSGIIREQFNAVESMWNQFWQPLRDAMSNHHASTLQDVKPSIALSELSLDEDSIGQDTDGETDARHLPGTKMFLLCQCSAILEFIRDADYIFYQYIVDYLVPNVLKPIPSSLTHSIRNFAKNLHGWLSNAMAGAPAEVVAIKTASVNALSQMLRRYTSLNHLAQAARAVLHNTSQIQQMLSDLNRVDFYHVQEQASWVCECDRSLVAKIEKDFKEALLRQNSLEQWVVWLESVVDRALATLGDGGDFGGAARQFLLKWSFYSSMVIRDLTLRSAPSFGSFHLIRLLFDEFIFYLVENKVAAARNESPIAVMGKFIAAAQSEDVCCSSQGVGHLPGLESARLDQCKEVSGFGNTLHVSSDANANVEETAADPGASVDARRERTSNRVPSEANLSAGSTVGSVTKKKGTCSSAGEAAGSTPNGVAENSDLGSLRGGADTYVSFGRVTRASASGSHAGLSKRAKVAR